jgi:hypothetical protein
VGRGEQRAIRCLNYVSTRKSAIWTEIAIHLKLILMNSEHIPINPISRFPPRHVRFAFAGVSILILLIMLISILNTAMFVQRAHVASGTVSRLVYGSCTKPRCAKALVPMVHFKTEAGQDVTFLGRVASLNPPYAIGEAVEVYYPPDEPTDARINSAEELRILPFGLFMLPLIFGLIGFRYPITNSINVIKRHFFMRYGTPIITRYEGIGRTQYRFNHHNYNRGFKVLVAWLNPNTNKYVHFRSRVFWYDPQPYLRDREILVYVSKFSTWFYWVDVDFLPRPQRF